MNREELCQYLDKFFESEALFDNKTIIRWRPKMHLLNRSNFENAITLSKNIGDGLISSSENIARLVDLYNDVSIEEKYSIIIHNMNLPEYVVTNVVSNTIHVDKTLNAMVASTNNIGKSNTKITSIDNIGKSNAKVMSIDNSGKSDANVTSLNNTRKMNHGIRLKENNYGAVVRSIKERITNES